MPGKASATSGASLQRIYIKKAKPQGDPAGTQAWKRINTRWTKDLGFSGVGLDFGYYIPADR